MIASGYFQQKKRFVYLNVHHHYREPPNLAVHRTPNVRIELSQYSGESYKSVTE